jgi:hypothetical protein
VAISLYKFKEVSIAFPLLPAGAPPHLGDRRIPGVEGASIIDHNTGYKVFLTKIGSISNTINFFMQ